MDNMVTVAILAHVAEEPLSDGNTRKIVFGRLEILEMILTSLSLYNNIGDVPIVIFDTGDMREKKVLESISRFGFRKINTPSIKGFNISMSQNEARNYIRYGRENPWSTEFKDKAMRFIESCSSAVLYALKNGSKYLLAIEGDTVLFGKNYINKLIEALENKPIANCSFRGRVYTDFWIANVNKVASLFDKTFEAMTPPYYSEDAFTKVFTDRMDLNSVFIGEKSLDQLVLSQNNNLNLPKDYFINFPYSWLTHPSQEQLILVAQHLSKISPVSLRKPRRYSPERVITMFKNIYMSRKGKMKSILGG